MIHHKVKEVNGMDQQVDKQSIANEPQTTVKNKEKELMKDILLKQEQVAHQERKINEHHKEIKHIEQSNTWKVSKGFRKIKSFFTRFFNREQSEMQQQVEKLQLRLTETEDELFQLKEHMHSLQLKDSKIHTNEVYKYIRNMKNEGELVRYLEQFIDEKTKEQKNYQEALTYAARLYMNDEEAYKNVLYEKILSGLAIEEIPEFMIRAGLSDQSIPLRQASSFRASLNMRMRQKQLEDSLPEWKLDDKRTAYQFAEKFGVRIPAADENHYTIDTLPEREGIAVKPTDGAGARGVYLVHQMDDIFDVRNSIKLTSWDKLKQQMQQDIASHAVETDDWMIEEIVYEKKLEKTPARDVKFYCFYGKVGLILEIIRYPEIRQCWWTASGKRISTGKYDENLFTGNGVTDDELQMAEEMSKQIPAPFIRIDFLRGEDGLVFGEFTPKPGNYDEFDEATDKWLGDYFLEAQGRLTNDLLNGKQFETYKAFVNQLGRMTV